VSGELLGQGSAGTCLSGMVICVDMSRHRGRHDSIFRRIGAAVLDAAVLGGIGARWSSRLGLHGTLGVTTHEIRVATEKKLAAPEMVH
jgi:hypothetical protein